MSMPARVSMMVPESAQSLLDWCMENDPRFEGQSAAAVVTYFFEKGLRAAYEESLASAEQMSADEFAPLAERQKQVFAEAANLT